MTEERKTEQKSWYPTIERMPLLYNVQTGPNLNYDNSVGSGASRDFGGPQTPRRMGNTHAANRKCLN